MNLVTLLDHINAAHKEKMLREIINDAFSTSGGGIDTTKPPTDGFEQRLAKTIQDAIDIAEKNLREIKVVDDQSPEDEALDDDIHTSFENAASEINNGGANEQIKHLIVEDEWNAKQVLQALADNPQNFSEIPR